MKTVYIERSVGDARDGSWSARLDLDGADRIVVGMGPGSFAGIRSAIAFAQGYSIATGCEVLGLPSPCALARDGGKVAVVGDARRGLSWIALFDGFSAEREIFLVDESAIVESVPAGHSVVSPDDRRIGEKLRAAFGDRYLGGETPSGEGLRRFAEANPSALVREPLPIYLNPAVR